MQISTSTRGLAFLEGHEGVVLKAYRCPAGVWTIGSGLTTASGVITVKAGMTITRQANSDLLRSALARNYEPRVAKAMPGAEQHEFDGGVSFDFNTGRIHNASWVQLWRAGATASKIRASLGQWTKGGGKVLPGLVRRRKEEADVILLDKWPENLNLGTALKLSPTDRYARFVISMTAEEIEEARAGFRAIGFDPGPDTGRVQRAPIEQFQGRYDLTVDGLIGRATLSTLQRELDARDGAVRGSATAAGGGALAGGNEAAAPVEPSLLGDPLVTGVGVLVLAAALIYGAWLAWHYRDMIAARLSDRLPKTAAWLRSF